MIFVSCLLVMASLLQALPSNGSQQQYNSGIEHPAVYGSPSPVTAEQENATDSQPQDWHNWFWPPVWSAWALVAVAIWGAKIARDSLGVIQQQTSIAKVSADAAKDSANALVSSDRAWMKVRLKLLTGFDYELQVADFGKTPGIVKGYQFARAASPRLEEAIPELQFWGTLNDRHLMLTREDGFQKLDNFKIWDYLEPWVESIQRGENIGIFAVRVAYNDIFRRADLHETLMVYFTRDGRTIENMPKHNRYS